MKITTTEKPILSEALNTTPEERELWEAAIEEDTNSLDKENTRVPDSFPKSQPLLSYFILKN